jgi:carbamoyltransferase
MPSKILGISAFYHDSAAALVVGGKIIAAAQEERFTREKHTSAFPTQAIKFCLEESGFSLDELDAVVFYDKPYLKFERLIQTYYSFAPKGLLSFLKAIPVWLKDKLFLKKLVYDGLLAVEPFNKKKLLLLFTEHHLSHAASAFYPSPFNESAIVTIDGVGEWCTTSIGHGNGSEIVFKREMHFPHSVGLLYSAFTYYLGFTVNSGEYKVMGLAPYGNSASQQTLLFVQLIKGKIVDIKDDGSIWLDQSFFNYATGLTMTNDLKWAELLNIQRREPESELLQDHCNLALALQIVLEEIVIKIAQEAKRLTGSDNLCLAGGVALNCVANSKLLNSNIFKNIFIQPAAGDSGAALGAALATNYLYFENKRTVNSDNDSMEGSFLGPEFSDRDVEMMNRKTKAIYQHFNDYDKMAVEVAALLSEGNIVGWFQGRMEFGPRALGNRSILADSRNVDMQKRLNLKIKYRESFRPFAPSVLAENVSDFFDLKSDSPYMLLVAPVVKDRISKRADNFNEFTLLEKLYDLRSDIQAVTHLDYSARVQSVFKSTNPRFWKLIKEFGNRTGYPIVINTSFNVRGEPIVCTPLDAFKCFMSTEMDYLVINNCLYKKTEQIDFNNIGKWITKFKDD